MQEDTQRELVGRWETDPSDTDAINEYGRTSLVFGGDGSLTYIIHVEGKDQVMVMTYRIEGSMLITDQPSRPGEERTAFTITPDGKLVLDYGGIKSRYVRVSS
jgi:hypothetical protein